MPPGQASIARKRKWMIGALLLFVGVGVYILIGVRVHFNYKYPSVTTGQLKHWPFLGVKPAFNLSEETKCLPPNVEIFNKDVLPFYVQHDTVNCPKLFNKNSKTRFAEVVAFTVKNGTNLHQLVDMNLSCCYQPFVSVNDSSTSYSGSCVDIRNNVTVIPSGIHYIEVQCKDDKNQLLYHDGFPLAHPPMLKNGTLMKFINSRLNIVVIGLDATSRLNFQRFMPLSQKYLLSPDMSAITLHGYSIVGRGTRENMFPMLSGLSYQKLERQCYDRNLNWNNCSEIIWEQASKRGYITYYVDDYPAFDIYYKPSFNAKPPTDYYLWPFVIQMKTYGKRYHPSYFCLGTRLGFQVLLNFVQSVSQVALKENRPHFQFLWASELAHDNINSLSLGDVHLLHALKKFKKTGVVNNTVIMILGDHGNSILEDYFRTMSGRIEYTLPVAHIVLPPWFKAKHPKEYRNMVRNSRMRTTPYDIFETMMDIMDLELPQHKKASSGGNKGHGISLFQSIPERRSCSDSRIPTMWCNVCHAKIKLDPSDPLVKSAAKFVVNKINNLTRDRTPGLCHKLGLFKVLTAEAWHPKDVVMELYPECATCTSFENQTNVTHVVGLLFTTKPNATFLAEVRLTWTNGNSKMEPEMMKVKSIFDYHVAMRIDQYAETGHCVKQFVKAFCICITPMKKPDVKGS